MMTGEFLDETDGHIIINGNVLNSGILTVKLDDFVAFCEENNGKFVNSQEFEYEGYKSFSLNYYTSYSKETKTFNFVSLYKSDDAYATDMYGNKLFTYPAYNYLFISENVDGFSTALAVGADNNTYVILFDEKGNEIIEPKQIADHTSFGVNNHPGYYTKNNYKFICFDSSFICIDPDNNYVNLYNLEGPKKLAGQGIEFSMRSYSGSDLSFYSISGDYYTSPDTNIVRMSTGEIIR